MIQWKLYKELVSHIMQYQTIVFLEQLSKLAGNMAKLKTLSVKKYIFSIKLFHAYQYLQYVCNISTKCQKDPGRSYQSYRAKTLFADGITE